MLLLVLRHRAARPGRRRRRGARACWRSSPCSSGCPVTVETLTRGRSLGKLAAGCGWCATTAARSGCGTRWCAACSRSSRSSSTPGQRRADHVAAERARQAARRPARRHLRAPRAGRRRPASRCRRCRRSSAGWARRRRHRPGSRTGLAVGARQFLARGAGPAPGLAAPARHRPGRAGRPVRRAAAAARHAPGGASSPRSSPSGDRRDHERLRRGCEQRARRPARRTAGAGPPASSPTAGDPAPAGTEPASVRSARAISTGSGPACTGPRRATPMYSAWSLVSWVSRTPSASRCSRATFSSRCLGST